MSSTPLALFQAPSICCMTMSGMESGSEYAAPFHATANWSVGRSGSRTRTSEPVKYDGSCASHEQRYALTLAGYMIT